MARCGRPTVAAMAVPLTIVDSFTDRPFSGNPAGVCRLDRAAPEAWMQAVAAEVNLSETAFVVPRDDGSFDLRWFTPTTEVELCGHATLASAHVLGGAGRFHTHSGLLTCTPGADGSIEMDFPAKPLDAVVPFPADEDWASAVGLAPERLVALRRRGDWLLLEVPDGDDVRAARPDEARLGALGGHCLLVADTTGAADGPDAAFDSVCRLFAPGAGIAEDPVTGSAHCVIGPWLAERTGRTSFTGSQASIRGGVVGMRVEGDDRVVLSGTAVTVTDGQLLIDPPT
ncbi:MAG: PhzF family phenazine biosynthesis protein [Acidimicrobiales bacterium]|nr:PhzF family phenazine biosynthesis protein [Acidimicrobiales bacterium]